MADAMTDAAALSLAEYGPWNPGVESQVPEDLRHLCTIFRPQNSFTSVAKARELRDLTGLDLSELVAFRPRRLALHELLIRVTADFWVPDGPRIEDLGINFRRIVSRVLLNYIDPEMNTITLACDAARGRLTAIIESELAAVVTRPAVAADPAPRRSVAGLLARFVGGSAHPAGIEPPRGRGWRWISEWEAKAHATGDELHRAAYTALARVVAALFAQHGRIWVSHELIVSIATDIAWNDFGSEEIGRLIEPCLRTAAATEGYRLLPPQERPVVMNTKGPSASGKSTLRPLQRMLAGDIGVSWSDFAVISPDIWRKQLLDYGSLGSDYKYGGPFTGDEMQIIDQKLDRYMARKAERGSMSHLLIDRFRFDSFAPDSDEAGSNLLTRFGHVVYLFFMITPPESLVERAWNRGLEVGRYKAVDDTLAHAVEAYSGMPQLFFTWVQRTDKRVHFEFLDNSVKLGERPRTVAFGWNDELNVLDVGGLLDVERFRRVNVDATAPEFLYSERALLAPERNTGFLRQCVGKFRGINFADQATGRIYIRIESGKPAWADPDALAQAMSNPDTRTSLSNTVPAALDPALSRPDRPRHVTEAMGGRQLHTLGRWGTSNQVRTLRAIRAIKPAGADRSLTSGPEDFTPGRSQNRARPSRVTTAPDVRPLAPATGPTSSTGSSCCQMA